MADNFDITQIGFSEPDVIIKQNDGDKCIDMIQHCNGNNI